MLLYIFHQTGSGTAALEGELHLLQLAGIGFLVLGMIIYQWGKNREREWMLHSGRALIAGSVILNFSPLFQGDDSQKTLIVALLFGMTGIILSSIIFLQTHNNPEEEEEHYNE